MRLIDADALMKKFAEVAGPSNRSDFQPAPTWNQAVSLVESAPAVDVAPVVHGENIGEDYAAVDQFVCSKCGIELQGWYRVERDVDDGEETHHEYVMRYCPNCGTRMDGGESDAAG